MFLNKKKSRLFGDFDIIKDEDLPHKDIIKMYPFFDELKNNPVLYLIRAGYLKKFTQTSLSTLSIVAIVFILLIFSPRFLFPAILIFGAAKVISVLIRFISAGTRGGGKKAGEVSISKIPVSLRQVMEMIRINDVQKFIDIALSSVTGKDIVMAMIALRIKGHKHIIQVWIFYTAAALSLIITFLFNIQFSYFYIPAYFICYTTIFHKEHNIFVLNEIRMLKKQIEEKSSVSISGAVSNFIGKGAMGCGMIFLLIFLFGVMMEFLLFRHADSASALFQTISQKTGDGFLLIPAIILLCYTFVYPLWILYLFLANQKHYPEEFEIIRMGNKLSALMENIVEFIHDPEAKKISSRELKSAEEKL